METGNTREVVDLIEKGRVDMGFIEGECHSVDIEKELFGTDELFRFSVRSELEYGLLFRLNIEGLTFPRPLYTIRYRNKYLSSLLKTFLSFSRHCDAFLEV